MAQIVLIRPGSTEFDEQGRIQGTLHIPLTAAGDAEVRHTAEELQKLNLSVIYSSPCQAAVQTAGYIAEALDIKVKKLDSLTNVDHGLWQGMLIEDVKRKNPRVFKQWEEHPESVCPPEGEMLGEARERVDAALTKLQKKHKDGSIGLVAPEPLASVIHCVLSQAALSEAGKDQAPPASWQVLGVNDRCLSFRGSQLFVAKTDENPGSISQPIQLES